MWSALLLFDANATTEPKTLVLVCSALFFLSSVTRRCPSVGVFLLPRIFMSCQVLIMLFRFFVGPALGIVVLLSMHHTGLQSLYDNRRSFFCYAT